MSYQVLARQWRPRVFEEMVGQEHVLRALSNALKTGRLHPAYLLSGTRGVGKTTLGRILAKCFNCETGITPTPCGQCATCQQIDSGRYIDLIEVDAASRTSVEDTRELLDNVQYAPSTGRFKIYLIDEVHMLTGHSFNALLKTLEEPPEHVKFIFATTDPQKLPATVLSRCLQFHLKNIDPQTIAKHLQHILESEKINFEPQALEQLSLAADGSVRDALSLLDQAIAFCDSNIKLLDVANMLGTLTPNYLVDILTALNHKDAKALLAISDKIAEHMPNFINVLDSLLQFMQHITIAQVAPEALPETVVERDAILAFAKSISAADIQLYYQTALIGKRDLPLAPTPLSGLQMILLRMLAFQPGEIAPTGSDHNWNDLVGQLQLSGPTAVIAKHCAQKSWGKDGLVLTLDPQHAALLNDNHKKQLQNALQKTLGQAIKVQIEVGTSVQVTPHQHKKQQLNNDPNVQNLMSAFNATMEDKP